MVTFCSAFFLIPCVFNTFSKIRVTSLTWNKEKSDVWPWKWGVDLYTNSTYTQVNTVLAQCH